MDRNLLRAIPRQKAIIFRRENYWNGHEVYNSLMSNTPLVAVPYMLNSVATRIYELCDGLNDIMNIVKVIMSEYEVDRKIATEDVISYLKTLDEKGFIQWHPPNPSKKQLHSQNRDRKKNLPLTKRYLRSPFLINWSITSRCNLSCKHCYVPSDPEIFKNELSTLECLNFIKQLKDMKVPALHFLGGEPLIRDDLFTIAYQARKYGILTYMTTNGTLISDSNIKDIRKSFSLVLVSLDGPPQIHNFIRGHNTFQKTMKGILTLTRYNSKFGIVTCLSNQNVDYLNELETIVTKSNAEFWSFLPFIPVGQGKKNENLFKMSASKMVQIYSDLQELRERNENIVKIYPPFFPSLETLTFFKEVIENRSRKTISKKHFLRNCFGGASKLGILPNGDVMACDMLPWRLDFVVGNIRENTFMDIWHHNDNPILMKFRNGFEITGKCQECELADYCRGGCRAMVYGLTGSLNASNPICLIREYLDQKMIWDGFALPNPELSEVKKYIT